MKHTQAKNCPERDKAVPRHVGPPEGFLAKTDLIAQKCPGTRPKKLYGFGIVPPCSEDSDQGEPHPSSAPYKSIFKRKQTKVMVMASPVSHAIEFGDVFIKM